MKRLSESKIQKLVNFRREGLSYKKIAKLCKFSPATVLKYTHAIFLTEQQSENLRNNETANRKKFSSIFASEKNISLPLLSPKFANVMGHIFFDGNITIQENTYWVQYTNSSFELITDFKNFMEGLFSITCGKIYKYPGINFDYYQIYFYSKKLCEFFLGFSNTYSTSKGARVPQIVMNSDMSIKKSFLQSFWDDEGCIALDGSLSGASMSEKMIDDLVLLHKSLGITCVKKYNRVTKAFIIYINRNFVNFLKFYEKAGFTKSIVTRGKNAGKCKADVLSEKISLYRKRLKQF